MQVFDNELYVDGRTGGRVASGREDRRSGQCQVQNGIIMVREISSTFAWENSTRIGNLAACDFILRYAVWPDHWFFHAPFRALTLKMKL